ncbi:MAG: serine/threonine-protein kinase [Coleofasciculaceae cyanobacterium]
MPIKRRWQFWKSNSSLPQTQSSESQTARTESPLKSGLTKQPRRWLNSTGLGRLMVGVLALSGAIATALDVTQVQRMERIAQTVFFQLRGPVLAPDKIVILAIDEESLSQGQFYQPDSPELAYLELLTSWPWKREAYAVAIDKLMAAGAKSVGLDIILDRPSSYGREDDQKLQQVLEKYAGNITLAATYSDDQIRQGNLTQLLQPAPLFRTQPNSIGTINFPLEADGRIHRLASQFPELIKEKYSQPIQEFADLGTDLPSFAQATLQAAGISYPPPKGENIFFYGPSRTFEIIPFWYVLDPNNWNNYLESGKHFQDKIVLIGGTANLLQDFHPTPFSETALHPELMSGVEIHANAIATLQEGRSIAQAIPNLFLRGVFIFTIVAGVGFLLTRFKRNKTCLFVAIGVAIGWGGISYLLFNYAQLILPTALPITAITFSGITYATLGLTREYIGKIQLKKTLKRYSSSPIIQEIISQQDDLQDLIREREEEILDQQLAGRYKIVKVLGSGGFGETYIARDIQRPGHPQCVVKQLRPASDNPQIWKLARRLFLTEAETLERLGKHEQIPQLLAYFEEGQEFYLVEEFISGHALKQELPTKVPLPESKVVAILGDLLQVLEFVHSYGVIHRDIKPDNIIRRDTDGRLVLIDFGAVKEINNQLTEVNEKTNFTIGIGTKGYTPQEQAAGSPKFNSDIYATGMIAIQALALTHPSHLSEDNETGEIIWEDKAKVSPELTNILNKMVRSNFRERYQSAREVLEALRPLIEALPVDLYPSSRQSLTSAINLSTSSEEDSTQPWSEPSTVAEMEGETQPSSDSSTLLEEDSTQPWPEPSTVAEMEEETQPWPES